MNKLIDNIRQWGLDKGITGENGKGTVAGQIDKLKEEYFEVFEAHLAKDDDALRDGIGDCFVVLVLLAERAGTSIEECANLAYEVIAKRTGKMVNGMFVKDVPMTEQQQVDLDYVQKREWFDEQDPTDTLDPYSEDDDDVWEDLDSTKACQLGDETCESCQ